MSLVNCSIAHRKASSTVICAAQHGATVRQRRQFSFKFPIVAPRPSFGRRFHQGERPVEGGRQLRMVERHHRDVIQRLAGELPNPEVGAHLLRQRRDARRFGERFQPPMEPNTRFIRIGAESLVLGRGSLRVVEAQAGDGGHPLPAAALVVRPGDPGHDPHGREVGAEIGLRHVSGPAACPNVVCHASASPRSTTALSVTRPRPSASITLSSTSPQVSIAPTCSGHRTLRWYTPSTPPRVAA